MTKGTYNEKSNTDSRRYREIQQEHESMKKCVLCKTLW